MVKFNVHVISCCFLLCVHIVLTPAPSNYFSSWWDTPKSNTPTPHPAKDKGHNFTTAVMSTT